MNPTAHHAIAAIEKLVRIFATTVPAFLAREKPISRNAKPACMNMTKHAATITQSELIPTVCSSLPSMASFRSSALANAPGARSSKPISASGIAARYFLFIEGSFPFPCPPGTEPAVVAVYRPLPR